MRKVILFFSIIGILMLPQSGEPVNYLMYPYAQIGDKAIDWLDPGTFKYTITYTHKSM